MKYRSVANDYLAVFLVCAGSLCTVLSWLLLTRFVHHEIALLEAAVTEAHADFEDQTSQSWKILRSFNLDNELLRQRREVHLQQLSRARTVGFINRSFSPASFNPPAEDNSATIGIRQEREQQKEVDAASQELTLGVEVAESDYQPVYQQSTYSSSNYPGPPAVSPYEVTSDYEKESAGVETECKCAPVTDCPAGPPGPQGVAGTDGTDGEAGTAGVDGKSFDDVMESPPILNACTSCPEGERGPPGPIGSRGRRGPRGASGSPGMPGRNGNTGSPGTMGPEGLPGVIGELGRMGYPGMNGIKGQGKKGPKGIRGGEGPMGPPGDDGDCGVDGEVGPDGVVGEDGEVGPTGNDGIEGPVGHDGEPGQDAEYCPCPRRLYHYSDIVKKIL
uniref:Col_cuticle_N domain-containing protein n=1 Tax=Haemonchus contortus TaxID=6289 RepID=A0A7I4YRL7_HAECO